MSLSIKTKKLEIVTIDLWNTIFTKSNKKEMFADLCVKYGIIFEEFMDAYDVVKEECSGLELQPAQGEYWRRIINMTSAKNTISIASFTKDMNHHYETIYQPQLVYSKIGEFLKLLVRNGTKVRILSNTGYLRGDQVQRILKTKFNIHVPVIGSDLLGVAKPNYEFYTLSVSPKWLNNANWLHIGDCTILDIEPVSVLGGQTYQIKNVSDWIKLHKQWLDL